MMETKIENQEGFETAVKEYQDDYFTKYEEAKEDAIVLESFYTKTFNDYNNRMNILQNDYLINSASIFIQEWIYNNNSKKNSKTEFEILTLFCEKNKYDLQVLALAMAEFKAIKILSGNLSKEIGSKTKTTNENKLTVKSLALKHVYLAMFKGQPVTQQNKDELAKKYNFKSGDNLRNEFTYFQNEDNRVKLSTTNKRAANEHLQRIKNILPLLENENIEAYKQAKNDLLKLEDIYNKHH